MVPNMQKYYFGPDKSPLLRGVLLPVPGQRAGASRGTRGPPKSLGIGREGERL